jgi:DNA ligase-associated metallophosphoesterase
MDVQILGVDLRLLFDRGVYWSDQRTLFVADTHFGKDATFRHHGIGVPTGGTDGTLAAVGRMLRQTAAMRLVILGDMFHARSSLAADVKASVENFFADHDTVEFVLVRGNHDAHVGALPSDWPVEVVDPGTSIGRVGLNHDPSDPVGDHDLMLCGHVHPSIRVPDVGKLACFHLSGRSLVLPAIGQFTGTYAVTLGPQDRAWLVAENEVIEYRHVDRKIAAYSKGTM